MAYKTWKEAYDSIVNEDDVKEAKYTNVHNKIKGIRNLSRKDADMIANIDPAVLGPVVKALAPMFEDVNEDVEQINELAVTFRNKRHDHGISSAEKKGLDFDRKVEQKHIEGLLKMISKMDAIQKDKMQYNAEVYGPPSKFSDALMAAESALLDYYYEIKDGKYDGKVKVDRLD
jgi:hypothetical protein